MDVPTCSDPPPRLAEGSSDTMVKFLADSSRMSSLLHELEDDCDVDEGSNIEGHTSAVPSEPYPKDSNAESADSKGGAAAISMSAAESTDRTISLSSVVPCTAPAKQLAQQVCTLSCSPLPSSPPSLCSTQSTAVELLSFLCVCLRHHSHRQPAWVTSLQGLNLTATPFLDATL